MRFSTFALLDRSSENPFFASKYGGVVLREEPHRLRHLAVHVGLPPAVFPKPLLPYTRFVEEFPMDYYPSGASCLLGSCNSNGW